MRKPYVLVLHAANPPLRSMMIQYITAIARYCKDYHYVFHHLNAPLTDEIRQFPFDAVIMNFGFAAHMKTRDCRHRNHYTFLAQWDCPKFVIVQDDYTNHAILDEWIKSIGASVVFTPLNNGLENLYPQCYPDPDIEFRHVLTGYTDSAAIATYKKFSRPWRDRTIDIGSRVRLLPAFYGRHGLLKGQLTETFAEEAQKNGFKVDVSTRPEDVLNSDAWLDFLASCKFSIGAKGGASLADPTGEIRERYERFSEENPGASFDEIEAACFPGLDMEYLYEAVSPRLFECAALGVCQILVGTDWPGGIKPFEDYIPLEEDLSNLAEVFEAMRDDKACDAMTKSCRKKLVESGAFDFKVLSGIVASEINQRIQKSTLEKSIQADNLLAAHFDLLSPFETLRRYKGGFLLYVVNRLLDMNMRYGQLSACHHALRKSTGNASIEARFIELGRKARHPGFLLAFLELQTEISHLGEEATQSLEKIVAGLLTGDFNSLSSLHWDGCYFQPVRRKQGQAPRFEGQSKTLPEMLERTADESLTDKFLTRSFPAFVEQLAQYPEQDQHEYVRLLRLAASARLINDEEAKELFGVLDAHGLSQRFPYDETNAAWFYPVPGDHRANRENGNNALATNDAAVLNTSINQPQQKVLLEPIEPAQAIETKSNQLSALISDLQFPDNKGSGYAADTLLQFVGQSLPQIATTEQITLASTAVEYLVKLGENTQAIELAAQTLETAMEDAGLRHRQSLLMVQKLNSLLLSDTKRTDECDSLLKTLSKAINSENWQKNISFLPEANRSVWHLLIDLLRVETGKENFSVSNFVQEFSHTNRESHDIGQSVLLLKMMFGTNTSPTDQKAISETLVLSTTRRTTGILEKDAIWALYAKVGKRKLEKHELSAFRQLFEAQCNTHPAAKIAGILRAQNLSKTSREFQSAAIISCGRYYLNFAAGTDELKQKKRYAFNVLLKHLIQFSRTGRTLKHFRHAEICAAIRDTVNDPSLLKFMNREDLALLLLAIPLTSLNRTEKIALLRRLELAVTEQVIALQGSAAPREISRYMDRAGRFVPFSLGGLPGLKSRPLLLALALYKRFCQ